MRWAKPIKQLLIILLVVTTLFLAVAPASVLSFTGLLGFGGLINGQIFCANGTLLFVGSPRGGTFMYTPGISRLYARFTPFIGRWILGVYSSGGACTCPGGNCEAGAIGAQGTTLIAGTS